jgi:hypothetical protein
MNQFVEHLELAATTVICTFLDSMPVDSSPAESEKPASAGPKCGMPLPCGVDQFDVIDVFRCPNCDALFERGQFVCYGAKVKELNTLLGFDGNLLDRPAYGTVQFRAHLF